jgi:hypothetical protein
MARHLTHQAMAKAMRYPEAKQGGKREAGSSKVSGLAFSKQLLSNARAVLRHSLPLAQEVAGGQGGADGL